MHNAHIRTPGTWTGILLAAELTAIAFGLEQALNGDDGGVWAPGSIIEIDGAGVSVTGPTYFNALDSLTMPGGSTLTIGGEVDIAGTFNVPSTGHLIAASGSTTVFNSPNLFTTGSLLTCAASG